MSKIRDSLLGSATHADAILSTTATKALERNGLSPAKALAGFIDRLRVSAEVRALIGADYIRGKALAYLEARAADMKSSSATAEKTGGVHLTTESHIVAGPAGTESGEAQPEAESQLNGGLPAADPVVAHSRHKSGNALRRLAEAQASAMATICSIIRKPRSKDFSRPLPRKALSPIKSNIMRRARLA